MANTKSKKTTKQSKRSATNKAIKAAAKRTFFEPTMKIVKLVQGNPRREGSWGHQSLGIVKSGMTVEKFVEKGGRLRDLHWDVQHGNVELKAA